jgi:DNA polymerase III delta prime subunit
MSTTSMVLERLKNEFSANSISHAYLISGDKMDTRELVDKVVNMIQEGKNEALDNLKCLDEGNKFGVKELRIIQNQMMLSSHSTYKTCYIENIERLSIPAINSMLKILEEPPKGVIFFLGCKNKNNVLDTIISRCRGYEIQRSLNENTDEVKEIFDQLHNASDVIVYVQTMEDKKEALIFLRNFLVYSRNKTIEGDNTYADICILTQKTIDDLNSNVNFKLAVEVFLLRVVRLVSSISSN